MESVQLMTFESTTRIHQNLLKCTGILPFEGRTYSALRSKLFAIYMYTCLMIHTTMFTSYTLKIARHGVVEVGNMSEVIVLFGIFWRYVHLFRHRVQFLTMFRLCEDIWDNLKFSEKVQVSYFTKKSCLLSWLYIIITGLIASCYVLTSYIMKPAELHVNGTSRRMLPYKFYVDVQETPWFEMVCALQIPVVSSVGILGAAVDTVAPFLSMMICGYLKLLQNRLHNITKVTDHYSSKESEANTSRKDFHLELVSCIKYHQQILTFCGDVEKLTRSLSLSAILGSLYNMSLIGLQLIGDDPGRFKYIFMFLMYLMQFFVYQWASGHLIEQSIEVANAAYLVPPRKDAEDAEKLIVFMIMRSQKPLHLTAGGFIHLSMEQFGSMMTSAFSFFTVLRRLTI